MVRGYTNIEQSRKLAEILPLESADFQNKTIENNADGDVDDASWVISHCWSLAALLEELPYEICDDEGNSFYLQINKEDDIYQLVYEDPYGDFESIETDRYEHFVDACYEMILRLYERKLL